MGNYVIICYDSPSSNDFEAMEGYYSLAEAQKGMIYWSKKAIEYGDSCVMSLLFKNADGDYRPVGNP
jgi:hypothetical protein